MKTKKNKHSFKPRLQQFEYFWSLKANILVVRIISSHFKLAKERVLAADKLTLLYPAKIEPTQI
jgi:hypothetical protein